MRSLCNSGREKICVTMKEVHYHEWCGHFEENAHNQSTLNIGTGSQLTLSGVVTASSGDGFTKSGTGTLELTNGSNAIQGNIDINAGTLLVNNSSGEGTGSALVTVNTGGTLGGSGTIGSNITVQTGGNHTAGTTGSTTVAENVAIQNITNDISYESGSSITWDLIDNSTAANTAADQFALTAASDVTFAATTSFILDFNGSGDTGLVGDGSVEWDNAFWDSDQVWTVFSGASVINNFAGLSLTNGLSVVDASGQAFNISTRSGGSLP